MDLTKIIIIGDSAADDWGMLKALAVLLQAAFPTVELADARTSISGSWGDNTLQLLMISASAPLAASWIGAQRAKKILIAADSEAPSACSPPPDCFDLILQIGDKGRQNENQTSPNTRYLGEGLPAMPPTWLENLPRENPDQFVLAVAPRLPPTMLHALENAVELANGASALKIVVKRLSPSAIRTSDLRYSDLVLVDDESDLAQAFQCAFFAVPMVRLSDAQDVIGNQGYHLSATLITLMENPLLRRNLVAHQRRQLDDKLAMAVYRPLIGVFEELGYSIPTTEARLFSGSGGYRVEGPFDTSYSLAMVNRYTALGLARSGERTSLAPVEAIGTYSVPDSFYRQYPEVGELVSRGETAPVSDTVLRLMYPLRLTEMYGINNGLCCYGWEESAVPATVVEAINHRLQVVTTMSSYVSRVLEDNGVYAPTFTTGIGADHILESEPDGKGLPHLGDGLKFLHISSCFPRKGMDVLLNSYGAAFTGRDEVTLVIKTFPNPHHDIEKQVAVWRSSLDNPPAVIIINRDLKDCAIRHLYQQADVLVAPSRGEGFGLPLAEAMLHRVPVITTGYGGQMDFCTPETAWLVDFKFAAAETHMGLSDSVWVEPDPEHLRDLLLEFHGAWTGGRWSDLCDDRVDRAYKAIDQGFRWRHVARRIIKSILRLETLPAIQPPPLLGVVTTWNSKCGIAAYSRLLLEPALSECIVLANRNADLTSPDEDNVVRCWDAAAPGVPEDLLNEILARGIRQVLFQFNFGFFSAAGFKALLEKLHDEGIQTFVTCHSTAGGWQGAGNTSLAALQPELSRVEKLFVHSINDLNHLKAFGAITNTCLFPHGVAAGYRKGSPPRTNPHLCGKKVIGCYGFLLPHKGLLQLIEAFASLLSADTNLHLLLVNAIYPAEISTMEATYCRNLIRRRKIQDHVTLITDYLEDEDSINWLQQADLIVFPYQKTSESSSAAIRWGLASGKPVYCTPLSIFDDVRDVVNFLPGTSPDEICQGLAEALALAPHERSLIAERQRDWLEAHDWAKLSRRLKNILKASFTNRTTDRAALYRRKTNLP